jgi:hypothetical protein
MEISDGIPDLVRISMTWEGRTYLYEDKRVCLDGLEELTEYKVNECHKIFVRLFLGKGFLVGEDSLEQVQGGYLTRPLRNTCVHASPPRKKRMEDAVDPLGRTILRPWLARPADAAG